jgi:hypothetical protein
MHLRMMKLFAGGPDAQSEALRMVTEKTSALAEATMTLARAGPRRGLSDDIGEGNRAADEGARQRTSGLGEHGLPRRYRGTSNNRQSLSAKEQVVALRAPVTNLQADRLSVHLVRS